MLLIVLNSCTEITFTSFLTSLPPLPVDQKSPPDILFSKQNVDENGFTVTRIDIISTLSTSAMILMRDFRFMST